MKRYEEIRKLTTGLLIKSKYKLIAVDLSRQNKLDADPKVIKQIEVVEQLKKTK